MKNENSTQSKLTNAKGLLEQVFEPNCRPTLRWLRSQQKAGRIRFTKVGRLVFFDPVQVKADLFPSQPAETRTAAQPETMPRGVSTNE